MKFTKSLLVTFTLLACLLTVSAVQNETDHTETNVVEEILSDGQDLAASHSAGMSAADVHPLTADVLPGSGKHTTSLFARHQHRKVAKRCKSAASSVKEEDVKKSTKKKSDKKKASKVKAKSSTAAAGKSELATKQRTVAGSGNYKRVEKNRGSTFWSGNNWDFWSYSDPTHGQVAYQSEQGARQKGLIGLTNDKTAAFLRVSNKDSNGGPRPSVRFQSKRSFDSGLVIFDVAKMPVGCATWPALWTTQGSNWPHGGEIDVMEGVGYTAGGKNANQMTVHMGENSPLNLKRRNANKRAAFTGRIMQGATNCNQWGEHTGCAFFDENKNGASWGTEFNDNGGGIWAMQFGHGGGVKIWFWGRKSSRLPKELSQPTVSPERLNPTSWGTPVANFQSDVIDNKVKKQNIIINITLGGDWAGNVPLDGHCKGQSVWEAIKKGSNYDDAEFILNGVDVYCLNGNC